MNKHKTLTYCGFMVTSLAVVLVFVSATTYIQLVFAVLLYIPLAYFAFKFFPRRARVKQTKAEDVAATQPEVAHVEKVEPGGKGIGIADIDKRVFLKLIGGAGISLFLFSIFNKRAEGLFFKNLPAAGGTGAVSLQDIAGNKIDPAKNQPTDGYSISEVDDSVVAYYGFTNKDGAWFVMKEDSDTGSFRYARGASSFPGSWTNRENLKYDYFSNIF